MKGSIVYILLAINCFLCYGDTNDPTVSDCQHHIDEAIKAFSEAHNITTVDSSITNDETKEATDEVNEIIIENVVDVHSPDRIDEQLPNEETESRPEETDEDTVKEVSPGDTGEQLVTEDAAVDIPETSGEPPVSTEGVETEVLPAASEEVAEPAEEPAQSEPQESSEEPTPVEEPSLDTESNVTQEEAIPVEATEPEADVEPELDIEEIPQAPEILRSVSHIEQILTYNEIADEKTVNSSEKILKDLKTLYTKSVKPMENLYKYKDVTTRQLNDAEIFSSPLLLVIGPWGSGKSTAINYLLGTEYTKDALRTGTEHKPGFFHIVTGGDESELLQGSQIISDWRFSGLQKFGQSLLDKLKGRKLPHPFLKNAMIVEVPGVLESRVHDRSYPFNDVVQWFLDRADLVLVIFDPTKQDVGPEMEAVLDQLKGRESQVRYILNKADSITPQDLMNVQASLLWTLSPVLGTKEPPSIYPLSLRSIPLRVGAPVKLLQHNEETILADIKLALDKRVENRINHVRKHAVRVHNHAKMVDCYLNAYYKTKGIFSVKKKVAQDIAEHPHDYHIYDTIATVNNVSRYDLPDPEVYRDFFKIHNMWEFPTLDSTCTYFGGCALDKLNQALAIELPKLLQSYHAHDVPQHNKM